MQTTPSSISEPNNTSNSIPTRSRRSFTPQEREAILQRYRASGLKQDDFIAVEGISKATLGKWLQQQRRQAKAKVQKPRFQEVLMKPTGSSWQLEIVSPQNWTVRLAAMPASVSEVLRLLPC